MSRVSRPRRNSNHRSEESGRARSAFASAFPVCYAMNFDILYSYLIDVTWVFLGSWVALLAAAYVVVFGRDRA